MKWTENWLCYSPTWPEPMAYFPRIDLDQDGRSAVTWHDGIRSRTRTVSRILSDSDSAFSFEDPDGTPYTFQRLDLQTYRDKVRALVHGLEFKTEEALYRHYRAGTMFLG